MEAKFDSRVEPAPPIGDELPSGTILCQGQYSVVRYLNSGGFGVTYLALDSLGRKVVIKECFPGAMCCRSEGTVRLRSTSHEMEFARVVELFEREAKALAQLEHPNIVGVHQIFKDNGTAYMAMDFIEGMDLFNLQEAHPELLKPAEVKRVLLQLLDALAFVHENGMLHRDIAPDNILLAPGGTPVLIDFGAAREGAVRATRMLSRIHMVKDGYSPQEFYLADGSQGESSDLYALAATFHHLIVGTAPPNSNIRLAAVAQNEPDPYEPLAGRVAGYDDGFLGAIDKCLSLFAKDRLPTALAWTNVISGKEPLAMPVNSELSEDVKRHISQLVTETSTFIQEAEVHTEEKHDKSSAAPDPLTASRAAEREYWAILNEDPKDLSAEALLRQSEETPQQGDQPDAGSGDQKASDSTISKMGKRWAPWLSMLFAAVTPDRPIPASKEPLQPVRD